MHLVSCRHTISGCRSDNHFTILSIRCLMELTFQLAMRMGRRSPVFKDRGRMAPFEPIRKLGFTPFAAGGGGCRRRKPCARNNSRCDGAAFRGALGGQASVIGKGARGRDVALA